MEVCFLSNKMKKIFQKAKRKCSKLLSSNSASTNNLSEANGSVHAQYFSQQNLAVQQETCNTDSFVVLADEKRLEVPVVNSMPLRNCDVEVTESIPRVLEVTESSRRVLEVTDSVPKICVTDSSASIQTESSTCTTVVAVSNRNSDTPSVDDNATAVNVDTTVCVYEQPPGELVPLDDIPSHHVDLIRNEALQQANREYPFRCYDFCLICCDEDYSTAENVKDQLCSSFNLTGCMIENDTFMLGRDIFQAYELMMDRSTKVFFLITDAFNRNPFNVRLQNGAVFQTLMSRVKKEKCVPILPNEWCEIPLPLSGITGISFSLPPQVLQARVNKTYTEEMRGIRLKKEQVLLEMRNRFYNEMLARKADEHRANILRQQQNSAVDAATRDHGNRMALTDGSSQSGQSATPNSLKAIPGLEGILENVGLVADQKNRLMDIVCGATSNSGSGAVSVIGSEQVRIGNDVNITVIVGQNGATEVSVGDRQQRYCSSSSSDSAQSSESDSDED